MRWCQPEEFQEFKVMPRMVLDHLPDNVFKTLTTILEEQKTNKDSQISLQSLWFWCGSDRDGANNLIAQFSTRAFLFYCFWIKEKDFNEHFCDILLENKKQFL